MTALDWAVGYYERSDGDIPGTYCATYRLNDLIARDLIDTAAARNFLNRAGLLDFVWQVTWSDDHDTADDRLQARFEAVQGYTVFIHGWTGNHKIWESLPALIVANDRRLISISIDHNGFGASLLLDDTPRLEDCNPPAAMRTIEAWIDLIGFRAQEQPKVINFVGHSMGGAALFYLDPLRWQMGEETRYAIAPALLLEDEQNRLFYTTLGIGIGIVNLLPVFEIVERALRPGVIDTLCVGASAQVKLAHTEQYQSTPRGITAATFVAMGLLNNREIPRNFDLFRVILGHRDRLVDLVSMMDLLSQLEFPAQNIRVVAGTHYLFSVGIDSVFQHAQNRELVVQDIVSLHERAYALLRQSIGVRQLA
jgi:pimeloyl-ACP methyl ester carboxylesterase